MTASTSCGRDPLVDAISAFLTHAHVPATPEVRRSLERTIDDAGPEALAYLGQRLGRPGDVEYQATILGTSVLFPLGGGRFSLSVPLFGTIGPSGVDSTTYPVSLVYTFDLTKPAGFQTESGFIVYGDSIPGGEPPPGGKSGGGGPAAGVPGPASGVMVASGLAGVGAWIGRRRGRRTPIGVGHNTAAGRV